MFDEWRPNKYLNWNEDIKNMILAKETYLKTCDFKQSDLKSRDFDTLLEISVSVLLLELEEPTLRSSPPQTWENQISSIL